MIEFVLKRVMCSNKLNVVDNLSSGEKRGGMKEMTSVGMHFFACVSM